jgi:hypothetical protein
MYNFFFAAHCRRVVICRLLLAAARCRHGMPFWYVPTLRKVAILGTVFPFARHLFISSENLLPSVKLSKRLFITIIC